MQYNLQISKFMYPTGKTYERVVPIGKIACEYTDKYMKEIRQEDDNSTLFLSTTGKRLTAGLINASIKRYLFKSGLRKHITAHSFRVSCATYAQ